LFLRFFKRGSGGGKGESGATHVKKVFRSLVGGQLKRRTRRHNPSRRQLGWGHCGSV